MAQVAFDDMTSSPGLMTPNIQEEPEDGGPLPLERPPKPKGRKRFLQSLQRISSSPSLARLGRNSSSTTSLMGGSKASMSCVSLVSSSSRHGHSYGPSFSSTQSSAGFSTAPTSVATTPGPEAPISNLNGRLIRIGGERQVDVTSTPRSVPLPSDLKPAPRDERKSPPQSIGAVGVVEDYFSKPIARVKSLRKRKSFAFWKEMPYELRMHILKYLGPKELVRSSSVSRAWHKMCFDGQLWVNLDTEAYYRDISAASLTKIMTRAGPFLRDLNLRGCVQMPERWGADGHQIPDACRNLEQFSLEGCRIDRSSVHHFLIRNPRLVQLNLSGLKDVSNSAMRIIAQGCPQLEHLNVSWCQNIDTRGLLRIAQACTQLRDLRAGEIKGLNDRAFLLELFERNTLERLILSHCNDLDDESLHLLLVGENPKIDVLTDRPVVPPRKLRHLDLSRCASLTDVGVQALAYNVPDLIGLQISHCSEITDDALSDIFKSVPNLTHLDLEELDGLSNSSLHNLAQSPCNERLQHLNISFCENLGDSGMLQVVKACPSLKSITMDNTRVSDLVLTEAAAQVWERDRSKPSQHKSPPKPGLHVVVYDCQNVTWTGVREILCRNTEPNRTEVVSVKCFYGYQDTVNEHMKRVLRGDAKSAARLERKWAEYMIANEEANAGGGGSRRRRRRMREAALLHADEEEGGPRNGRRRARSGGCAVM
ncbi:uncharacterized protein KY384_000946 [Bacidia gigantensis]|uniref:uncharacterized protein n=1 Tax=Bacidia gigantensis TaxID=2732470 RepID=UPI001D043FD9|nr:uncharacterized protein KY384_000946 [Bacidia gigantensis]KAG8534102.1 hypothetical protein KY384_000946 [Bacidia gigantensis]